MAKVQPFTPTTIDALKTGKMSDPLRAGLFIEVGKRGKIWKYYRRIGGSGVPLKMSFGGYPANTMAAARAWADDLNQKVERGVDPREAQRESKAALALTVDAIHAAYIEDITKGARKTLKPRTISDKVTLYNRDVKPSLGSKSLGQITPDLLWQLVEDKGEVAPVRANRMAAELKVFFKWCVSRAGQKAGVKLQADPATTLNGKHFEESKGKERYLTDDEIKWFFQALAMEQRMSASTSYRRGFLLLLLTGCRRDEVIYAPSSEYRDGVWHIPGSRVKNDQNHIIKLGPWGQSLMQTNSEWLIPHPSGEGPISEDVWYNIRDRILRRMTQLAGYEIPTWSPHDLRRTLRSNSRKLGIDYETREAMLNHVKKGLERRYDVENMEDDMADGFARWELKLIGLAHEANVADALGCPLTTSA